MAQKQFIIDGGFKTNANSEIAGNLTVTGVITGDGSGLTGVTSYVSSDFSNDFASKTTDDLAEGSNLYFTEARAVAAVSTTISSAVSTAVSNLVDGAPGALNTLNELAAALGDDANFASSVTSQIGSKLASADFDSTFDTRLSAKSTTDLSEGENLYFTDARARLAIGVAGGSEGEGEGEGSSVTYNNYASQEWLSGYGSGWNNLAFYNGNVIAFDPAAGGGLEQALQQNRYGWGTQVTLVSIDGNRTSQITLTSNFTYNSNALGGVGGYEATYDFVDGTPPEVVGGWDFASATFRFTPTNGMPGEDWNYMALIFGAETQLRIGVNYSGAFYDLVSQGGIPSGTAITLFTPEGAIGVSTTTDFSFVEMGGYYAAVVNIIFNAPQYQNDMPVFSIQIQSGGGEGGGSGSGSSLLSYNSQTGVFTFANPAIADVTGLVAALEEKATIGSSTTFASLTLTGDVNITGNIVPSADITYDLGSPTMQWKDIYVGPGSLYVNGSKVLEDDQGTITVTASTDQSLTMKTVGTGAVTLQSDQTVNIAATLQMGVGKKITDASGNAVVFGDKIDADNNQIINVGTPTATGHAATKGYVDAAVSNLINGAPGALDTLNELANALGDDANFAATITNALAAAVNRIAALEAKLALVTSVSGGIRVAGTVTATGDITAFGA